MNRMKQEIEIGEYVRSKFGEIKRVDKIFYNKKTSGIEEYGQLIEKDNEGAESYTVVNAREVLKHSKNIIDLIEIGDYVNGYRVIELIRLSNEEISICVYKNKEYMHCEILKEKDIKTILTYEKYKNNCYEAEE